MNNYQQQSAGGDSGGGGGGNVCVLEEKDENGVTTMPNATPMVAVPGITFSQSSTDQHVLHTHDGANSLYRKPIKLLVFQKQVNPAGVAQLDRSYSAAHPGTVTISAAVRGAENFQQQKRIISLVPAPGVQTTTSSNRIMPPQSSGPFPTSAVVSMAAPIPGQQHMPMSGEAQVYQQNSHALTEPSDTEQSDTLSQDLVQSQPLLELMCEDYSVKPTCNICSLVFRRKNNMYRHMRVVHGTFYVRDRKANMTCPLCKHSFDSCALLYGHFSENHEIVVDKEVLEFSSLRDFKDWKENMERETRSFFRTTRSAKNGLQNIYVCNRTGIYTTKRKGEKQRELKAKGSKLIGGTCPARITMDQRGIKITVSFVKTHVGHEPEIGALYLTFSERQYLAQKMAQGVTKQELLDKITESFSPTNRLSYLTLKDLHNISQSFSLDKPIKLEGLDDLSVESFVQQFMDKPDNPILLYKPQGGGMSQSSRIGNDDFLLGYMDMEQQDLFERFGSDIVMMDSTHGTNPNNIKLTTVMVVDENCEGLPVAFLFSVSESEATFCQFFRAIKARIPSLSPKSFMTDDAPAFYSAWRKVFFGQPQKLLCTWHVKMNLFQNLSKIGNIKKKKVPTATLR